MTFTRLRTVALSTPAKIFFVALAFSSLVAAMTLRAPSAVFPHSDWFDGGIRLLRDDHELNYYFQHVSAPSSQQGYPPLAILYFSIPRFFVRDFTSYENIFVAMNAVLYAALVAVTAALFDEGQRLRRLLLFALPGFVYFSLWRFDVLPAFLVAAALLAVKKKSPEPAFILLIAAGAVKWYPLLLLPAFFMHFMANSGDAAAQGRFRKGLLWMLGIGAVFAVVASLIMGPTALIDPILFHFSRDFEIAAFGTVLLLLVENLFHTAATAFHALLARVATIAQFAAVIPILWKGFPKDFRSLIRACVFVLIPFIALGPVFSSQWIVWLTPLLLPVADGSEIATLAALDLAVYLQYPITFGIFPYSLFYFSLTIIRTLLFFLLWWRSCRALFPPPEDAAARHLAAPSNF